MPRKHRIHFFGAFYHVINRGNGRTVIFDSPKDYTAFLESLSIVQQRFPFVLHAYCLMPNHFHLLLEVQRSPLSIIMRSLQTRYARLFNRSRHRVGHLFQGRYRAILCQKDAYLLELVRYLHLNPVRARIVQNPAQWLWSSHRAYVGRATNSVLRRQDVMAHFRRGGARAFADYVLSARDIPSQKHFYPPESFPLLGDKAFLESAEHAREPRRRLPAQLRRFSIQNLADRLIPRNGPKLVLNQRSRPRQVSHLREQLAYAAVALAEIAPSRVAEFLRISPSGVTRCCRRFQEKMSRDPLIEKQLLKALAV